MYLLCVLQSKKKFISRTRHRFKKALMSLILFDLKLRFNFSQNWQRRLDLLNSVYNGLENTKMKHSDTAPNISPPQRGQEKFLSVFVYFLRCWSHGAVEWGAGAQKAKEEKEIFTLPESQWNDFRKQTLDCDERVIGMEGGGGALGRGNINLSCWTLNRLQQSAVIRFP